MSAYIDFYTRLDRDACERLSLIRPHLEEIQRKFPTQPKVVNELRWITPWLVTILRKAGKHLRNSANDVEAAEKMCDAIAARDAEKLYDHLLVKGSSLEALFENEDRERREKEFAKSVETATHPLPVSLNKDEIEKITAEIVLRLVRPDILTRKNDTRVLALTRVAKEYCGIHEDAARQFAEEFIAKHRSLVEVIESGEGDDIPF